MRWDAVRTVRLVVLGVLCAGYAAAQEPSPSPPPAPPAVRPTRGAHDQRRTVRGYPANLAYNFMGVVTRGNYPILAAGALLTAPSFLLDDEVDDYFTRHPHDNWGKIGRSLGGTLAVSGLTVGFFSAGRVARGDRFRATTYDVSQAIIINFTYTMALKLIVGRDRPDHSDHQSFPSGHASNAFAGASVIAHHYGDWLGIPAYGVATYIAASRLASHRHHLSDVVAGSVFGYGVGRAVYRRNSRPPDAGARDPGKVVVLQPDPGPAGDGAGLRLAVRF
jgi:membrane-associated phospholipid phosphatase